LTSTDTVIARSDGANILHVGPGETFSSLSAAVAASQDGDTIQLDAGTYLDDSARVTHAVTIEGVGGMAHLQATGNIANGKAIIVDAAASLTVRNIEFSGAQVADGNGAGIRYEQGNLVVQNSQFHDNQDGILSAPIADGHATIDGSSFVHNGAGDSQTHGAYFGTIAELTVTNSFFQDQNGGSDLKSRAASNLITNSTFADTAQGQTNYQIDLSNAGVAMVADNQFVKNADPGNRAFIHFGGEIGDPSGALVVEQNQFSSDRNPSVAVLNQTDLPVSLSSDSYSADVSIAVDGLGTVGADLSLTGLSAAPLSLMG
jgi:hypothetical protein